MSDTNGRGERYLSDKVNLFDATPKNEKEVDQDFEEEEVIHDEQEEKRLQDAELRNLQAMLTSADLENSDEEYGIINVWNDIHRNDISEPELGKDGTYVPIQDDYLSGFNELYENKLADNTFSEDSAAQLVLRNTDSQFLDEQEMQLQDQTQKQLNFIQEERDRYELWLQPEKNSESQAEEDARFQAEEDARFQAREDARFQAKKDSRIQAEEDSRIQAEEVPELNYEEEIWLQVQQELKQNKQKRSTSQATSFQPAAASGANLRQDSSKKPSKASYTSQDIVIIPQCDLVKEAYVVKESRTITSKKGDVTTNKIIVVSFKKDPSFKSSFEYFELTKLGYMPERVDSEAEFLYPPQAEGLIDFNIFKSWRQVVAWAVISPPIPLTNRLSKLKTIARQRKSNGDYCNADRSLLSLLEIKYNPKYLMKD